MHFEHKSVPISKGEQQVKFPMYNGWVLECYKKLLENIYFGTEEPNLKWDLYYISIGSALVSNLVQVKSTEKKWENNTGTL